eukprot:6175770-Amphidinium_carterae.1
MLQEQRTLYLPVTVDPHWWRNHMDVQMPMDTKDGIRNKHSIVRHQQGRMRSGAANCVPPCASNH